MHKTMKRGFLILAIAAFFAPILRAQQTDISKWPAKDRHQNFVVAARAYTDPALAKRKFGNADPFKAGILAVDVLLRNDTKDPIHVDLTTIRLNIDAPSGQRFHLQPLSLRQAASEIAHPKGPSAPGERRFPVDLPFPHGDSKQRKIQDKLRSHGFQTDIVPPGQTIRGCIFFDVNHHFHLVPYASLYVPDVKSVASNSALIYFEVALGTQHPH